MQSGPATAITGKIFGKFRAITGKIFGKFRTLTLIVENADLKKTNCVLRNRLQEAERDTSETKLELEMIEDMVKSINEHSNQEAFAPSVSPRQVPSAITALNILKTNHDSGLSTLNKEVKKLKESEENKTNELERLRHSLQDYS